MKCQSLTTETHFAVSPGDGKSVLLKAYQSPDFQSHFRTGESGGTPHSHENVIESKNHLG